MDAPPTMPPSHTDAHVLPDGAGSLRELLWVAIPLMISSGSLSAMGIIDRLLITGLSMDALAASMPAGMLHWTIMSIPFGIVTYVNTFVAQYEGAGRKEQVAACIWQGLWLSLLGGLAIILLIPLTRLVFQYNGNSKLATTPSSHSGPLPCWHRMFWRPSSVDGGARSP